MDEQPVLVPWTPVVGQIARMASEFSSRFAALSLPVEFNHALIQFYRSGEDYIGEHADKTLDIEFGTPIVSVSLGASRQFSLKTKAKLKAGTGPQSVQHV